MAVIGIDIGSSYICAAVCHNGNVEVVWNKRGNKTTPTFVAYTSAGTIVGEEARGMAGVDPPNTLYGIQRIIGRNFAEINANMDLPRLPYEIRVDGGKPKVFVECEGKKILVTPEEVNSLLIKTIKNEAQKQTGLEIKDAVITVPSYFNEFQKSATKTAGMLAGLNVMKIMSEPIAAALAYSEEKDLQCDKAVLIFDVGGTTTDATVMRVYDRFVYQVRGSALESKAGGEDLDRRIVANFKEQIRSLLHRDVLPDECVFRKLKTEAEFAKKKLSEEERTTVTVDSVCEGINFHGEITRKTFELTCYDIFLDMMRPIHTALENAKMTKDDIHQVIMVGGCAKIPKIRQMVQQIFEKPVTMSITPDEAVAKGAAYKANNIKKKSEPKPELSKSK